MFAAPPRSHTTLSFPYPTPFRLHPNPHDFTRRGIDYTRSTCAQLPRQASVYPRTLNIPHTRGTFAHNLFGMDWRSAENCDKESIPVPSKIFHELPAQACRSMGRKWRNELFIYIGRLLNHFRLCHGVLFSVTYLFSKPYISSCSRKARPSPVVAVSLMHWKQQLNGKCRSLHKDQWRWIGQYWRRVDISVSRIFAGSRQNRKYRHCKGWLDWWFWNAYGSTVFVTHRKASLCRNICWSISRQDSAWTNLKSRVAVYQGINGCTVFIRLGISSMVPVLFSNVSIWNVKMCHTSCVWWKLGEELTIKILLRCSRVLGIATR